MRASIVVAVAAAAVGLVASVSVGLAAEYQRSPAYNFSAPLYQSPGGVGRQGAVYGNTRQTNGRTATYQLSCGSDHTWNGDRCVDRRE